MIKLVILTILVGAVLGHISILIDSQEVTQYNLAVQELSRYIYIRTNHIPKLVQQNEIEKAQDNEMLYVTFAESNGVKVNWKVHQTLAETHNLQELKTLYSLKDEEHIVKSVNATNGQTMTIIGGRDPKAALFATYLYIEQLGVSFAIHGDIIPTAKLESYKDDTGKSRILPKVNVIQKPIFAKRGLQPFHDFPEGPDWWNENEYKHFITQINKMRMNIIGLHTYPLTEPTVWVGVKNDSDKNGSVRNSYSSSYANSLRGTWGYVPKRTSEYSYGTTAIFSDDCFGADVQRGACPLPTTLDAMNTVFDKTGQLLKKAFSHAKELGVYTVLGTETPLLKPNASTVAEEYYYEGIFSRIMNTHHLDYYWFWTNEQWQGQQFNESTPYVMHTALDMQIAHNAAEKLKVPFQLATCGWEVGPDLQKELWDILLPSTFTITSIDMWLGTRDVDPAYKKIVNHKKWAIPWMEDDPGLSCPQLWVGRTLSHGNDAVSYDIEGLLGIHWRTKTIAPTISALAHRGWNNDIKMEDFYHQWAEKEFGKHIGSEAADIFAKLDGAYPRACVWKHGPGNVNMNKTPWSTVQADYALIDKFAELESKIHKNDTNEKERFDYWNHLFQYSKSMAKVGCIWGEFDDLMISIKAEPDILVKKTSAKVLGLPIRIRLITAWEEMMNHLLQYTSSTGELGTIMNLESNSMNDTIVSTAQDLEALIGELPENALPSKALPSHFVSRLIVPTARTTLSKKEQYELRVQVLDHKERSNPVIYVKKMGVNEEFEKFNFRHLSDETRQSFVVILPTSATQENFEYYVQTEELRYPLGDQLHTVVVY